MKKIIIGIVIIIVLIGAGILVWNFQNKGLTDNEVLQIVMPDIINYCDNSLDKNCATCAPEAYDVNSYRQARFPKQGEYLREDRSHPSNVQNKSEFWLEVHIPLNYVGENYAEGSGTVANFKMDTKGSILHKKVPMTECKIQ